MTDLAEAFASQLDGALRVDIAVAWLGPSRALNEFLAKAQNNGFSGRIVVGLSGSATSPVALHSLQACSTVSIRIAEAETGIFHPKVYLFHNNSESICWVGSANFTFCGFERNHELIHEFTDSGEASKWFEQLWSSLPDNSVQRIEEYANAWTRPKPATRSYQPGEIHVDSPLRLFNEIETWPQFVDAVRRCDSYWPIHTDDQFSVLGESWSWLDTIQHGFEIARRADWSGLPLNERRILLGVQAQPCSGEWGLLGGMGAAGAAVGSFHDNSDLRQRIRYALQPAIDSQDTSEFITAAVNFIQVVCALQGFGPAIATRFLALARPDRAISVNGGSAPNLAQLTTFRQNPATLGNRHNYPRLLRWLYDQPWYVEDEPHHSFDRMLWSARAALIDCFVYKRV